MLSREVGVKAFWRHDAQEGFKTPMCQRCMSAAAIWSAPSDFVVYILWHQDHASPESFFLGQQAFTMLSARHTLSHYTFLFPLDIRIAETIILPYVLLWFVSGQTGTSFLEM